MITSIENGGTTKYSNDEVFLLEVTNTSTLLNGWIFSLWGIYDYLKLVDDENIKKIYNQSINTLKKYLHEFDNGYWSKYNLGSKIASPFYHRLHIAQLKVMYDITEIDVFKQYALKWEKYLNNPCKKGRAFVKKAFQKIFE